MKILAALLVAACLAPAGARAQFGQPYSHPPSPYAGKLSASAVIAPVPPAVLTAKRVFLSNAGADSGLFPHPFSGTPDRPYVAFYTALKTQGYEIVASPADADLVMELKLTGPVGPQNPNKADGAPDPLPMIRLVIYDRPTHYVLWALTESVEPALSQKTHDRNLDNAVAALATDLQTLKGNSGVNGGAVPPAATP